MSSPSPSVKRPWVRGGLACVSLSIALLSCGESAGLTTEWPTPLFEIAVHDEGAGMISGLVIEPGGKLYGFTSSPYQPMASAPTIAAAALRARHFSNRRNAGTLPASEWERGLELLTRERVQQYAHGEGCDQKLVVYTVYELASSSAYTRTLLRSYGRLRNEPVTPTLKELANWLKQRDPDPPAADASCW